VFATGTTLRYELDATCRVRLSIFDLQGRRVEALVARVEAAGAHEARWDGTTQDGQRVAAGVYFAVLVAGTRAVTSRLVVTR
jgi:hypothetical protein